ncbi:MAG TPA: glycosyltransferase [bacterium]|nr:glycosyltransferase [bacterium]
MKTVTVAIGTHNRREILRKCLSALAAQTYPAELIEVVVVDNESSDGSREMVESFKAPYKLKYAWQKNRADDSSNVGARLASGEIVIFIDDDVIPHSAMVEEHVKTHERNEGPAAVIGRLDWPAGKPMSPFEEYACSSGALMACHKIKDPENVDFKYALHGNISFRREDFLKTGGYTGEYYMADTVFAHRAKTEFGMALKHNPAASADHVECAPFPLYLDRRELCGAAAVSYVHRHPELAGALRTTLAGGGGAGARSLRAALFIAHNALRPLIPALEKLYPASKPLLFFSYRVCALHRYLKGARDRMLDAQKHGLKEFVDPLV